MPLFSRWAGTEHGCSSGEEVEAQAVILSSLVRQDKYSLLGKWHVGMRSPFPAGHGGNGEQIHAVPSKMTNSLWGGSVVLSNEL